MGYIDETKELEKYLEERNNSEWVIFKSQHIFPNKQITQKKNLTRWLNTKMQERYLVVNDFYITKYGTSKRNQVFLATNLSYMNQCEQQELMAKVLDTNVENIIRKFFITYEDCIRQQSQIARMTDELAYQNNHANRIVQFCRFNCDTGGVSCENRHCPLWTILNKQRQIQNEINCRTKDQSSIAR